MLSKRQLKKLPFRKTGSKKRLELSAQGKTVSVRSQTVTADGETVLVLSYEAAVPVRWFQDYGQKSRTWLKGQTYCQRDGFISRLFMSDGTERWSNASPTTILEPAETGFVFAADRKRADRILARFAGVPRDDRFALGRYEARILKLRNEKRHTDEINRIRADIDRFPDLPDDYADFGQELFRNDAYVFVADGKGYCTACGNEFPVGKGMLNKSHPCPCCKRPAMYRSARTGRKNLPRIKWSLLVRKDGDDLLLSYVRHVRDMTEDFRNPEWSHRELLRTVLTPKAEGGYNGIDYEVGDYKGLGLIGWRLPLQKPYYWNPSEWAEPLNEVTLYHADSMKEMFRGTPLEHSAAAEYAFTSPAGYLWERYIRHFSSKPYVEALIKTGFTHLADTVIDRYSWTKDRFASEEHEPHRILKLSKQTVRLLRRDAGNVSLCDLSVAQRFEEAFGKCPSEAEWQALSNFTRMDTNSSDLAAAYVIGLKKDGLCSIGDAVKYLMKQDVHYTMHRDYMGFLKELGIPVNSFLLFPKDLGAAHDQRAEEVRALKDKIAQEEKEKFEAELAEMRKKYAEELGTDGEVFVSKKYLIRLPANVSELDTEGAELHHCVATYKQKVMAGQTSIYFIRKTSEPDKPFYTLEWRDGKVIQCHGLHNCKPTAEIQGLVDTFAGLMRNMGSLKAAV